MEKLSLIGKPRKHSCVDKSQRHVVKYFLKPCLVFPSRSETSLEKMTILADKTPFVTTKTYDRYPF